MSCCWKFSSRPALLRYKYDSTTSNLGGSWVNGPSAKIAERRLEKLASPEDSEPHISAKRVKFADGANEAVDVGL